MFLFLFLLFLLGFGAVGLYFNLLSYPLFKSASWYVCTMVLHSSSLDDNVLNILFIFLGRFFQYCKWMVALLVYIEDGASCSSVKGL